MNSNTYLVLDLSTNAILCFAPSKLTANIVSRGMLNTQAVEIPTAHEWRSKLFDNVDIVNDHICLVSAKGRPKIKIFEFENRTPEYYDRKSLATLRAKYIHGLELFSISNVSRGFDLLDETLAPFIIDQLNKSNPKTSEYTSAIQEYATLLGIPAETAYYELSMRAETSGVIRLRAQAIFDKYTIIINQSTKEEDFFNALNNAYFEQLGKARL